MNPYLTEKGIITIDNEKKVCKLTIDGKEILIDSFVFYGRDKEELIVKILKLGTNETLNDLWSRVLHTFKDVDVDYMISTLEEVARGEGTSLPIELATMLGIMINTFGSKRNLGDGGSKEKKESLDTILGSKAAKVSGGGRTGNA